MHPCMQFSSLALCSAAVRFALFSMPPRFLTKIGDTFERARVSNTNNDPLVVAVVCMSW